MKNILVVFTLLALAACGAGSFTASGVDSNGNPVSVDAQWEDKDKPKEEKKDK